MRVPAVDAAVAHYAKWRVSKMDNFPLGTESREYLLASAYSEAYYQGWRDANARPPREERPNKAVSVSVNGNPTPRWWMFFYCALCLAVLPMVPFCGALHGTIKALWQWCLSFSDSAVAAVTGTYRGSDGE